MYACVCVYTVVLCKQTPAPDECFNNYTLSTYPRVFPSSVFAFDFPLGNDRPRTRGM